MIRPLALVGMLSMLATACGPAEDVEVQPLPSLSRMSQESRAGLPEVAGLWRFVGWELARDDSASLRANLPRLGSVWLQAQRRDSIGGQYLLPNWRVPLYGEVRRDSVLAMVGVFGPGDLRYFAGRIERDTMWMETTSSTEPGSWPADARAAFARTRVAAAPFVRLHGAVPVVARVDSAVAADSAGLSAAPGATPPGAPAAGAPAPAAPPAARPGAGARPPTTPRRTPPRPANRDEEPGGVPLLGDPVSPDTTGN